MDDVVLGWLDPDTLTFFGKICLPVWHPSQALPDFYAPSSTIQAARGHPSCRKVLGRFHIDLPWVHKPFPETVTVVQRLAVVSGQAKLGIPTSANARGIFH